MRYGTIIAGGAGTRLWPMSRAGKPKQLLPIFESGKSLLQIAAERLSGFIPPDQQYICTSEEHRGAILKALPSFTNERILGEPVGRDTVNAVGLLAAVLLKHDPDAIFAVLTADHLIDPVDEFHSKLDIGFQLVEDDPNRLVTFSIRPTRPATGYGYVQRGQPITGFPDAFQAERFIEKPDAQRAMEYLEAGNFGWNSGMFVFAARTIMDALRRYLPDSHQGLTQIADAWGTPDQNSVINRIYPTLKKISIDYALMEPASADKSLHVCTVLMNVNWLDVGCWASFGETLHPDKKGNRSNANHIQLDSRNVLTISDDPEHTIATIGCRDLIIIRTADATLIFPSDQAQRVKDIAGMVDESLR